jgi:hypothetical protein
MKCKICGEIFSTLYDNTCIPCLIAVSNTKQNVIDVLEEKLGETQKELEVVEQHVQDLLVIRDDLMHSKDVADKKTKKDREIITSLSKDSEDLLNVYELLKVEHLNAASKRIAQLEEQEKRLENSRAEVASLKELVVRKCFKEEFPNAIM